MPILPLTRPPSTPRPRLRARRPIRADRMGLLALILIGAVGAAASAWALQRGGRTARMGAVAGLVALLGVTAVAFALRPGRVDNVTGAHLVATAYLRVIVGLWGLESIVLVGVAWLLGGLVRLRGLLPSTLAAMTGGTVALASADIAVAFAAGEATGLAALVISVRADGPAAVAAAARDLRVSIVGGAVLLGCVAVLPLAGRIAAAGAGSVDVAVASGATGGPTGVPAIALIAVVTTL